MGKKLKNSTERLIEVLNTFVQIDLRNEKIAAPSLQCVHKELQALTGKWGRKPFYSLSLSFKLFPSVVWNKNKKKGEREKESRKLDAIDCKIAILVYPIEFPLSLHGSNTIVLLVFELQSILILPFKQHHKTSNKGDKGIIKLFMAFEKYIGRNGGYERKKKQ